MYRQEIKIRVLNKLHLLQLAVRIKVYVSAILFIIFRKKLFEVDQVEYWSKRAIQTKDADVENKEGYYKLHSNTIIKNIKKINDVPNILEVGCYTGHKLRLLSKTFPQKKITGCDIGKEQLYICKNRFLNNKKVTLVNCSATNLPFKDNSFGLVLTSACLEHIPFSKIALAIGEIIRVSGSKILLVEAYLKHIPLKRRLEMAGISYFYMHDYEKILGQFPVEMITTDGIIDNKGIARYSLFLYRKLENPDE